MGICICDISSLEYWRHHDNRVANGPTVFAHTRKAGPALASSIPRNNFPKEGFPDSCSVDAALIEACGIFDHPALPSRPIHLLAPRDQKDAVRQDVVVHSAQEELPKGSLLRVERGISTLSPEMLFLRPPVGFDAIDHILMGYELCGCYSIRTDTPSGLLQRHPLCTPETIRELAGKMAGARGVSQALRNLAYVRGGSGSPRETRLAMILCLPMRYGGYGLPFPDLNLSFDLGSTASLFWNRKNAFDLVWKDALFIVEYNGIETHDGPDSRERDAARHAAIVAEGYSTLTITKSMLSSIPSTYAIASTIASKLGVRLRFRNVDFRQKHENLWSRLFGSRRNRLL